MTESVWITTTTLPDSEFDIFRFTAWLQHATLLELQIELLFTEICADEFTALWGISHGAAKQEAVVKANFYNSLYALIDNTIIDRTNAAFAPQYPN
jgi:hypothetical protein